MADAALSNADAEGLSDELGEMDREAVADWDAVRDGGTEAERDRVCDRDAVRDSVAERDWDLERVFEDESVCVGVGVSVRERVRVPDADCPDNSVGSCDGDGATDVFCDGDGVKLTLGGWASVADGVGSPVVTVVDCCCVSDILLLPD